jgi:SAM-dependent methyltransferase
MGISPYLAELIVREHRYKPLPSVVHTVGRMMVRLDIDRAHALLERCGVAPVDVPVEIDQETIEGRRSADRGMALINDRTFFGMLGVKEVRAIDINTYEGANIVLDLCIPIPDHLAGTVEFVVGASTLDNVFDPAQYVRNIARLLRPGGRMFELNVYVDRMRPYVILPPPWYFDFFVVNRFDDSKVYVIEDAAGLKHAYKVVVPYNPAQQPTWGLIDNFEPGAADAAIVAFAEKGVDSTWNVMPVQDAWRDAGRVKMYNEGLQHILRSPRAYVVLTLDEHKPPSLATHLPANNYHYVGHFPS